MSRLHPLLSSRWSPLSFDVDHTLGDSDVEVLLEAARWAPSAGNSQPWSFVVARRGEPVHDRVLAHLAPSSARWAPTASALLMNLTQRRVAGTDWEYSEFARYDLGQAVAHLSIQARALDLAVRQFRAFDKAGLTAELGVPDHLEVVTLAAVGRAAEQPPGDRERRSTTELQLTPEAQR